MKIINYIKANSISTIMLVLLLGYFAYRQLTTHLNYSELMNETAPAFVLSDLTGKSWSFPKDQIGKKTLLVFWTTWCGVCKTEIPNMVELEEQMDKTKFQMLAIVIPENESLEDLKKFKIQNKINYPILVDDQGIYRKYLVKGFPAKYWIEKDGSISDYDLGRNFGLFTQVKIWIDE